MSVSVVIPTLGTRASLWSSVEGALRAAARTGPTAEVLVVVNGTRQLPALPRSTLLRVLRLDRANVARARNAGLAAARNDTVLFGDDGAGYPQSWAVALGAALARSDCPVVTAPVRVPVRGPVTAFLNHQRLFDAPPVDAVLARTVTGNCGVRRDLLPGDLRFDENLPLVGEDVAFGHAVRAAGLPIRWLATAQPGLHLLPERIDEVIERAGRYGRGAALVWRRDGTGADPCQVLHQCLLLGSVHYRQYRRFPEVSSPGLRAAYTLYDYLYDAAFLVGYLTQAEDAEGEPLVDVDLDGLTAAWRATAGQAAAAVEPAAVGIEPVAAAVEPAAAVRAPAAVEPAGCGPQLNAADFTRLDDGGAAGEPLVESARRALGEHVRPNPRAVDASGPAAAPKVPAVVDARSPAADGQLQRLLAGWRQLRAAGGPIDADTLDHHLRSDGHVLREACAAIERAAMWRASRAAR